MNAAEEDAKFYSHMQQIMLYHQILLRDKVRNELFCAALKRCVTSETRVLDIGSGSGVWAITAAKLGAKKVTAIEGDATMIPVIQNHARENGVADKIEIVHGNSQEINLRHKYEVVVSETIGNQAFEENIIKTMIDARERFLAPGGILIPQKVALVAAPAHLESETETPLGVPLKTEYIKNLALNLNSIVADKSQLRILEKSVKLLEVDLSEIAAEPTFTGLTGNWKLKNISEANVFALWAEAELSDGIVLDTWNTINWSPVVCRFKPYNKKSGELRLDLNLNQKQYHWTVRVPSAPEEKAQSYTPFFAYAKLKFDARLAPKKRKPRKETAPGE